MGEMSLFFRTPNQKALVLLIVPCFSKIRNREKDGGDLRPIPVSCGTVGVVFGEGRAGGTMAKASVAVSLQEWSW